ncbi:MAG: hypothetical protein E2577_02360, partial [Starkeya sp.]|nr:hypothetical protein [Starkeya sp.]
MRRLAGPAPAPLSRPAAGVDALPLLLAAVALVALLAGHRPQWTPRDYGALAREGYQRNAIA